MTTRTRKALLRATLVLALASAAALSGSRASAMKVDCAQQGPVYQCCAETGYCCKWEGDTAPTCTGGYGSYPG